MSDMYKKASKKIILWGIVLCGCVVLCAKSSQAFPVKVVKFLFEIKGGPNAPFNQPTDVAVGKGGKIYVLDGVNARIQVFDNKGNYLFKFGSFGSGNGQFNMPLGMGVDRQGNIYVADSRNHRLQVFGADGKYVEQIALPKDKGLMPPDPADVLIVSPRDEAEILFVTDNDNHRILMYDKESLQLIGRFGGHGFEDEVGNFRYPFSLASDMDQENVFVVDVLNTRVQMMDNKGKFIRKIGAWGIREGTFFRPKGVAVDADDRVYVSDGYMGVVQIFKKNGSYVSVVGSGKNKEIKFDSPIRVYIDKKQRLFVVEELSHKVSVYSLF